MIGLASLARFASRPPATERGLRCEVCAGPLAEHHRHVVELGTPGVQCACHGCAILFARDESTGRYRTIPDRVAIEPAFGLSPARWAELGVPVAVAFCFRDSRRGRSVVCYPGPAGTTEAELDDDAWDAIAAATPLAAKLADDVEALIVRGGRGVEKLACYLAPISSAYELAGRLRESWEGFSGGARADAELATFFADLDRRADPRGAR